jgi:hypothetical protein
MTVFQTFHVRRDAFDHASIRRCCRGTRRSNAGLRITGCLLFSGRCFLGSRGDEAIVTALAGAAPPTLATPTCALSETRRAAREYADLSLCFLHAVNLDDVLETLLMIPGLSPVVVADVMERMRPDPVMGALR